MYGKHMRLQKRVEALELLRPLCKAGTDCCCLAHTCKSTLLPDYVANLVQTSHVSLTGQGGTSYFHGSHALLDVLLHVQVHPPHAFQAYISMNTIAHIMRRKLLRGATGIMMRSLGVLTVCNLLLCCAVVKPWKWMKQHEGCFRTWRFHLRLTRAWSDQSLS